MDMPPSHDAGELLVDVLDELCDAGLLQLARKALRSRPDRCSDYAPTSVAYPPLFPCLAEQALGEVETLLCFGQLLLEVLDTMFNCVEALRDVGRGRLRTSGAEASDLEDRERGNPYEYEKRGEKHTWFHVAFLSFSAC